MCVISCHISRWSDRREVVMLNSFMGHTMEEFNSSNPNNTREKPSTVLVYNATMGAVDHVDQTTKPYTSVRKSLKWYKKVAFYLIDIAIYNAHIVYCSFRAKPDQPSYKEFIRTIIRQIIEKYPVQVKSKGRPKSTSTSDRLTGSHLPEKNLQENGASSWSDCHLCNLRGIRKVTPYSCMSCKKRLCIRGGSSCFYQYHTLKSLPGKNRSSESQSTNNNALDNDDYLDFGLGHQL